MEQAARAVPIFAAALAVSAITGAAPPGQASGNGQPTQSRSEARHKITVRQVTGPGMMRCGMMGQGHMGRGTGMMSGGMIGTMNQMQTGHRETMSLMNGFVASMNATDNASSPAAMKSILARYRTMLEQMRFQLMQQGTMMRNLSGEIQNQCLAVGSTYKGPQK